MYEYDHIVKLIITTNSHTKNTYMISIT